MPLANGRLDIRVAVEDLRRAQLAQVSASSPSAGAITWAPARAASWTKWSRRPPAAPITSTVPPARSVRASCAASAASAASGAAPARHADSGRLRRRAVPWDADQLGPRSVVDGRICQGDEAEDLVAGAVAASARADTFDGTGEVSPSVTGNSLQHLPHHARGDRGVDAFTEDARTRTRISFSAGDGAGRSSRSSGGVSNVVMTSSHEIPPWSNRGRYRSGRGSGGGARRARAPIAQ